MGAIEQLPNLVQVYRNIHRTRRAGGRPVYSVRDAKTRRVVGHTDRIVLADARFVVSEAGRQRVLREGRKNVHAYIQGRPVEDVPTGRILVGYNPRTMATFVELVHGTPVRAAELVDIGVEVRAQGVNSETMEVRP